MYITFTFKSQAGSIHEITLHVHVCSWMCSCLPDCLPQRVFGKHAFPLPWISLLCMEIKEISNYRYGLSRIQQNNNQDHSWNLVHAKLRVHWKLISGLWAHTLSFECRNCNRTSKSFISCLWSRKTMTVTSKSKSIDNLPKGGKKPNKTRLVYRAQRSLIWP